MNLLLLFPEDFIDPYTVRLSGRRKDHILSVCKVTVGDHLRVGILNGKVGKGSITAIDDQHIDLTVAFSEEPPPSLPITLILALPRPKVLKRCLETIASMGVKKLFIIQSWRVEKSYWTSDVLSDALLREHLLLGLEQACDTKLPVIEVRKRFKPFVEDELPEISKGTRCLVAHPYNGIPCPCNTPEPITLAIGPEGGFIPYEIEAFTQRGFTPISLGQRIQRVETVVPILLGRLSTIH